MLAGKTKQEAKILARTAAQKAAKHIGSCSSWLQRRFDLVWHALSCVVAHSLQQQRFSSCAVQSVVQGLVAQFALLNMLGEAWGPSSSRIAIARVVVLQ